MEIFKREPQKDGHTSRDQSPWGHRSQLLLALCPDTGYQAGRMLIGHRILGNSDAERVRVTGTGNPVKTEWLQSYCCSQPLTLESFQWEGSMAANVHLRWGGGAWVGHCWGFWGLIAEWHTLPWHGDWRGKKNLASGHSEQTQPHLGSEPDHFNFPKYISHLPTSVPSPSAFRILTVSCRVRILRIQAEHFGLLCFWLVCGVLPLRTSC